MVTLPTGFRLPSRFERSPCLSCETEPFVRVRRGYMRGYGSVRVWREVRRARNGEKLKVKRRREKDGKWLQKLEWSSPLATPLFETAVVLSVAAQCTTPRRMKGFGRKPRVAVFSVSCDEPLPCPPRSSSSSLPSLICCSCPSLRRPRPLTVVVPFPLHLSALALPPLPPRRYPPSKLLVFRVQGVRKGGPGQRRSTGASEFRLASSAAFADLLHPQRPRGSALSPRVLISPSPFPSPPPSSFAYDKTQACTRLDRCTFPRGNVERARRSVRSLILRFSSFIPSFSGASMPTQGLSSPSVTTSNADELFVQLLPLPTRLLPRPAFPSLLLPHHIDARLVRRPAGTAPLTYSRRAYAHLLTTTAKANVIGVEEQKSLFSPTRRRPPSRSRGSLLSRPLPSRGRQSQSARAQLGAQRNNCHRQAARDETPSPRLPSFLPLPPADSGHEEDRRPPDATGGRAGGRAPTQRRQSLFDGPDSPLSPLRLLPRPSCAPRPPLPFLLDATRPGVRGVGKNRTLLRASEDVSPSTSPPSRPS